MYFSRWPAATVQKGSHTASLQNEAQHRYGIFQKLDYLCNQISDNTYCVRQSWTALVVE